MRTSLVAILILTSIAALPRRAGLDKPVRVAGGLVSGISGRDPSITVFQGVPFAAPPVADLRWRAPRPVVAWQGVRKADTFGDSCMQTIVDERKPWTYEFMTHTAVSEDCLYLNVWTAARSSPEKRPVYVYIYGGANTEGSGAVPVYNGEGLARKGIVVVTVNYRLGVLGFFTHPELTKESDTHASGNYALLDLIAALRWVHDYIGGFGGDPGNVTVGGQSAGASNTHSLTASPLARGLFHRAIAESGSSVAANPAATRTLADQEPLGVKFAEARGARSIAELRAMSWKDLSATTGFRFGVVVDGYVLPASVSEVFASGRQNDVPTLTGANQHEGGATPHPEITAEGFQKQARQRYGDLADEFLSLYPASTDEQARVSQNESSWDQTRISMYLWAMNRAKTARTNAFTYFWDHPLPGPDIEKYGAFHTSEVPYVMNALAMSDRPFTDADRRIADTLSSYWANFMKTGDPNGPGLPHWPAVTSDAGKTMEIGDRNEPVPVAANAARLAFFEKYFARQRSTGTR
jgi:para-nitrobenzyl esterase